MGKWYYWLIGGAAAGVALFFYMSTKKGGAPDQLAAARQARLDKLAAEKVTETPNPATDGQAESIAGQG